MKKSFKVVLSEQDLAGLLSTYMFGGKDKDAIGNILKNISKKSNTLKSKNENTAGNFVQLDLNNPSDFRAYQQIADKFISSRSSNLLGITGSMLANSAKNAQNNFDVYVPVELALAQLTMEGGFSENPQARPIRTKNPFNVGNVDSGKNVSHSSVMSGIQSYYDLISKKYLGNGKTASDLIKNFVNKSGSRYATDRNYENSVSKIASQVQSLAQPIYASISKKTPENLV